MPRVRKAADSGETPDSAAPLLIADDGPSREEWLALYDAAVRFRDLSPWEIVQEEQTFGVKDPETGEIGYCCIMGQLGEHRALAVYRGTRGLTGLWEQHNSAPAEFLDLMSLLDIQDCVMASFEDREMVEDLDREVMKALGLKFRGRGAWPLFRSYIPGTAPWVLTAAEARTLTRALEQAILITGRLQKDPGQIPPPPLSGPYLVRVCDTAASGDEQKPTWRDAYLTPEPPREPEPIRITLDDARLTRLQALPRVNGSLEMDLIRLPEPVQEQEGQRPVFPYLLFAVATQRGEEQKPPARKQPQQRQQRSVRKGKQAPVTFGPIVGTEVAMPQEAPLRFAEMLTEVIERIECLPRSVIVQQEEAYAYLENTARALGIDLILEDEAPAVNDALLSLMSMMDGL